MCNKRGHWKSDCVLQGTGYIYCYWGQKIVSHKGPECPAQEAQDHRRQTRRYSNFNSIFNHRGSFSYRGNSSQRGNSRGSNNFRGNSFRGNNNKRGNFNQKNTVNENKNSLHKIRGRGGKVIKKKFGNKNPRNKAYAAGYVEGH